MKDFLELFVAKRVFKIIGEYFAYSFKAFFRYWVFALLVLGIVLFFISSFKLVNIFSISNLWIWGISLLATSIPFSFYLYKKENLIKIHKLGLSVGVLETVMIAEKDYLFLNLDSEKIAERQKMFFVDVLKKKYPFKKNIINPVLIQKPKLYYYLRNLTSLKRSLTSYIHPEGYISVLTVIKDLVSKKVEFDILYSEALINSDTPFSEFKLAFNRAIKKEEQYDDYILEVTKVYTALQGQAIVDLMIDQGDFETGHKIIDDCEDIFSRACDRLGDILNDESNESFEIFKNNLLSNFERYRGVLYLNQKQYLASLRHVFKSIELNPFFPYNNYSQYKDAFNKRYAAEVNLKVSDIKIEMADENVETDNSNTSHEDRIAISEDLFNRIDFVGTPGFDDILKEIIARANSDRINDEVEKRFRAKFCASPICEMIRGEVLKYLPKGTAKHEALYLDRLPEVLEEFNKVLSIDKEFVLMYTRIGILKVISSFYQNDDEKSRELMKEGIQLYSKGADVYARLGMSR